MISYLATTVGPPELVWGSKSSFKKNSVLSVSCLKRLVKHRCAQWGSKEGSPCSLNLGSLNHWLKLPLMRFSISHFRPLCVLALGERPAAREVNGTGVNQGVYKISEYSPRIEKNSLDLALNAIVLRKFSSPPRGFPKSHDGIVNSPYFAVSRRNNLTPKTQHTGGSGEGPTVNLHNFLCPCHTWARYARTSSEGVSEVVRRVSAPKHEV